MAPIYGLSLRIVRNIRSSCLSNTILQNFRICGNISQVKNARVYSNDTPEGGSNPFGKPLVTRKKTVPIQKILLLSEEGKVMEQLTLEEAQNLAKRRSFNLVQMVDISVKTTLPVYQLMSKVKLLEEQNNNKEQKAIDRKTFIKATKNFVLASKIDKHDLEIMIKKMIKLLKKHHKVQIYVSIGGQKAVTEDIVKTIEAGIGENGINKKQVASGLGFKLYFDPVITAEVKKEKSM